MTTPNNASARVARELPKPLIYRERDLRTLTSLSRKAREDAMNAGTFPRPIPLGPKARGWLVSEIQDWIDQRKAARDALCQDMKGRSHVG